MRNIRLALEQLIESNTVSEDIMSFHGVHGFLTALTICPAEIKPESVRVVILRGEVILTSQDASALDKAICLLTDDIDRSFNNEDGFTLLYEEDQSNFAMSMEDWCAGFMEAHFLAEDAWFQECEQEVCELLMPIMLASRLFDDELEFRSILQDQLLVEDMCNQIPEVLMELYLIFHSPESVRDKDVLKGGIQRSVPLS